MQLKLDLAVLYYNPFIIVFFSIRHFIFVVFFFAHKICVHVLVTKNFLICVILNMIFLLFMQLIVFPFKSVLTK